MKKNHKTNLLFLVSVFLGLSQLAQAQISGTVTDDGGEALIGATIQVVGTSSGAVTDIDGTYSIPDAPAEGKIIASYVGYASITEDIAGRSVIDFTMKGDDAFIDEVVVVGYGVQNQEEITGAVAKVKPEDFNKGNIADASNLIQGKVSGLSITKPGGNPNSEPTIRLRGISTFGGATSPLILIDGVVANSIKEVDPNDIESIDVLKDAASSAIYGSRGSNGVILITTKKGNFAKKTTISYNGQMSFETLARTAKNASASKYLSLPNATDNGASVDYIDEISRTGFSNVQNLSIGGGSETTTYRFSGTYRDVKGTLDKSGFNQFNLRGNVDHEALEGRLRLNLGAVVSKAEIDSSFVEAFRYAATINPTTPIYAEDRYNINNKFGEYNETDLFDYYNPVAMINQNVSEGQDNNFKGTVRLDYDIIDDLTASVSYALNQRNGEGYSYYSKKSRFRGSDRNGLAYRNSFNTKRQTTTAYLNYNRDELFTNTNFDGLLGYTYEQTDKDGFNASNGNYVSDDAGFNQIGSGGALQQGAAGLGSYKNRAQLRGYFGRFNFNIGEYYNLNTNLRYEGTNAFSDDNQYGFFYGLGGSADLAGIFDMKKMDFLKFRMSYGKTGNLPSDPYLFVGPQEQNGYYPNGTGGFDPFFVQVRDANPNLKWEEKSEFNAGLDFEFAESLFDGSLNYFNTTSKDLILYITGNTDLFPITGNGYDNVGSITSQGMELLFNYNGFDKESFSWKPSLTSTFYFSNELKNLNVAQERIANAGAPGNNDTFMILLNEGGAFGQIYGAQYEGVDNNGNPIYRDVDGNNEYNRDGDNSVIGSGVPDWEFGFNNAFAWGNWDANVFLRGATGHDLVNMYRFFYENVAPTSYNRIISDHFNEALSASPAQTISTRVVEKANFVKVDNVTLGYTFPANSSKIEGIRLFGNIQNLATISGYQGIDPEVRWVDTGSSDNGNFATTDARAPGIDRRNTYGLPTTFTIGAGFNLK